MIGSDTLYTRFRLLSFSYCNHGPRGPESKSKSGHGVRILTTKDDSMGIRTRLYGLVDPMMLSSATDVPDVGMVTFRVLPAVPKWYWYVAP